MWVSRDRIQYLEKRIDNLERRYWCQQGSHVWGVGTNGIGQPYVRCNECYATPVKPTESKGES